ncbi:putative cyclin-B3-1 isoform X2 [Chenopodium quinoa]|uniref:putative cyclin-B3-1 isoform X2 n=1 Tax=Chenopodium quinoa TaxID=63459 RepID=UPI000B77E848|nr:putative cyclin-B3-1 isoform X2 [Chenopodium quinoa]
MVLLKGKTVIRQIKTTENWGTTKNVGMSKFKVYSDRQTVNGRSSDDADAKLPRTSLVSKKKATAPPSTIGTKTKIQVSGAELTRSCHGALDKTKVGRKALADVSNIRRQSSRFEKLSGSRNSVAFGTLTNTSSSSRSQAGNLKGNLTRGVSVSNTAVKVATATTKAQRASSNFHRVKVNETMENITRKISKNSNTITRKSFPVMKKASQLDSSDIKVDKTSEEKSTKKIGFPTKVGGKLAPQMSNLSGKVSKEKVNDNFPTKSLRIQTNKDAFGGVKIPVKPIARNRLQISNDQKRSKSKSICNLDKSFGTTPARKVKVDNSVAKTLKSTGSLEEVAGRGIPAKNSDNLQSQSSETTVSKNTGRRKSYTYSLISRSKLLKSSSEVREHELLPNIDDEGNPLEVAEYVDDIYEYYWIMEAQSTLPENYMMIQTDVTPQMRGLLINWLIEVHFKFDLMPETLYLTVALLDRYLSVVTIKKNEFQLIGLASLLLASKYEDFWHPKVKDLISISAESYTRKQMLEMEKSILKKLKFRLNLPTAYVFMLRFLKASQSDKRHERLSFYLIELCLVEYETLRFRPSLLCAAAVYVARCTLYEIPGWTSLLGKHTHHEEHQIRDCAEMILRIHKAASAGLLKVTYDKYIQPEFGGVAAIKPLDTLPL